MRWLLLIVLALGGCGPQGGQEPYAVVPGTVISHRTVQPHHLRLWRFDAHVIRVRPDADGVLIPPSDPQVLGWWGRLAGARHGTTLIVGHSVHGRPSGELERLAHTPVGRVAVVSGIRYRVSKKAMIMTKAAFARRSSRLLRQDGPPRLVIVTCANYDWSTGEWPDNAVLIARPMI